MRLRTLVLLTVLGVGGIGFASEAEAQRRPARSSSYRSSSSRSYRPAPRYYNNYRYSRPYYSYNYNYRPYSYGYRPFAYGYSYDPYYYAPYSYAPRYYYEPHYYGTPPYVPYYRRYYRPRVGISLHLGW